MPSDRDRMAMFDTIVERDAADAGVRARDAARAVPADEFRRRLRATAADLTHVPEDYAGGPDPADPRSVVRRGQARRGDALRAVMRTQTSAADDRAVLRVRRSVPAARRAFRGRELHSRRAPGRPDSRFGRRHALPFIFVRRGSRDLAVDDSVAGTADAPVQRRLGNCDLDCRCGTARGARGGGRSERPNCRHAAAGRGGATLRTEHGQSARRARRDDERRTARRHRPGPPTGIGAARPSMSNTERALHIGSRRIGAGEPCYVIAEVGINHNGDLAIAKQLVDAAVAAGADAVKFQKRKLQRDLSPGDPRPAAPRRAGTAVHRPDADRVRAVRRRSSASCSQYCRDARITALCTPWDRGSVDFLETCDLAAYKIGSPDLTNFPLIEYVAETGKPMLLSTGMSTRGGSPADAGVPAKVRRRIRALSLRQHVSGGAGGDQPAVHGAAARVVGPAGRATPDTTMASRSRSRRSRWARDCSSAT